MTNFYAGRDQKNVGISAPFPVTGPNIVYSEVTLSLDTNAYTSGDVLADTQVVTDALRFADSCGMIQSVVLIDEDDQGIALDLHFLSANSSLGTENGAPNISDANARDHLGVVAIASGDYKDLGGVRVATVKGIGLPVKAASGTKDIYVGAVTGGTPTHSASGLKLRIGIQQS